MENRSERTHRFRLAGADRVILIVLAVLLGLMVILGLLTRLGLNLIKGEAHTYCCPSPLRWACWAGAPTRCSGASAAGG